MGKFKVAIVCIIFVIIITVVAFISNKKRFRIPQNSGTYYTKQIVDIFNEQFTSYQGLQKGTIVRTLINDIIVSNATHEEDWQVSISGITTNINEALKIIKPENKYKVEIFFNKTISIVDNLEIANKTMNIVSNIEITLVEENDFHG